MSTDPTPFMAARDLRADRHGAGGRESTDAAFAGRHPPIAAERHARFAMNASSPAASLLFAQRHVAAVGCLSAGGQAESWFLTSNEVSSGGPSNPPSIPACMWGIRVPSRNFSQLSFES